MPFLNIVATPNASNDISPAYIARIIEKLSRDPPRNWDTEMEQSWTAALHRRYEGTRVPPEILGALLIVELLQGSSLVRVIQRGGARGTSSIQNCQDVLAGVEMRDISYTQVADTLLYMVLADNAQTYNPANFVAALRDHKAGKQLDWQDVVHGFDRPNLEVTKPQFLALYNALLPLALDYENFDIQLLWGGPWQCRQTQLFFVIAFLTCTFDELDISKIPRLRRAFKLESFLQSSESIKDYAAGVVNHPLVSLDATAALFHIIFESREVYDAAQHLGIPELVINPNTQVFVVAAAAVPKPWGGLQDQALRQLLTSFVERIVPHYDFVMDALWKQDSQWLADKLCDLYLERQLLAADIYAHAREHGWLDTLIAKNTELSLELASSAHGENALDIDAWAHQTMQAIPDIFPKALENFLSTKAEFELQYRNRDRSDRQPVVVPLTIKTVHALLAVLEGQLPDEDILQLQRACLQAYPRLVNYGINDKVNAIIEENSREGHGLSPDIEAQMTDYFKRLYRAEMQVREYVSLLQEFKQSEVPHDQDLFTCMIAGLFEEYHCFGEYPLEALAVTAVLFGSIINFHLLERIPLQAALAMVLEAVQEHPADDSMYKFGLQALLHFMDRLPEWPTFCDRLIRVPHLEGTEVWPRAKEIASQAAQEQVLNGNGVTNGNVDAIMAPEPAIPHFACVQADPPLRPDIYKEPNEDTQDKVLFVLNNISERNLQDKLKELQDALQEEHHQWFAQYLVEERAKSQPNFHKLYLDMLTLFNDRNLWAEVLRETYVTIKKLVNSESTMNSGSDRTNLKNLGGWLGSLTLARDRPIKFKNISFKDLLLEGHDSQRLTVVIPFTCKTLVQANQSTVFRPPNPWLMEIVRVLKELYEFVDMKLNLKFEVEVLCKDLGLDVHAIEAADVIRSKPAEDDYLSNILSTDGLDHAGFGDMNLIPLGNRRVPSERFSPNAILNSLPSLEQDLVFPPSSSRAIGENRLRAIFLSAVQQAISEIIAPVVERSVTIAAISSAQLVSKDFAMESDIDRFREAASTLVKSLSGSLALVTCKEPLRMSITNNIRQLARELPEQALPEGLVIMFVNDNLDQICKLIEQAAESQSIAEMEQVAAEGIRAREIYKTEGRPSEPFSYPPPSQWAFYIPEPFRQQPGGLNRDQLAVYEDFGRNVRGLPVHAPTPSQDNGRQVPDVIQDSQFPAIPSLPTPAEAPAIPRQPPASQQQRAQPAPDMLYGQNGGPIDGGESTQHLLVQLRREVQEAPAERIKDLDSDSPIRMLFDQLVISLEATLPHEKDEICKQLAWVAMQSMFDASATRLEVEVMGSILMASCRCSVPTTKAVIMMLHDDAHDILHAHAIVYLLEVEVLDTRRVDDLVSRTIRHAEPERTQRAVDFLAELVDELLSGANANNIVAFRADFMKSFEALTHFVAEHPDSDVAKSLIEKLNVGPGQVGTPVTPEMAKHDQLEYVFEEWVRLHRLPNPTEKATVAFIRQLHEHGVLSTKEESALFLRVCVDFSVAAYEEEMRTTGHIDTAYIHVDALARLLISMVVHQGEPEGAVKASKTKYFEATLALLILQLSKHHNERGEHFSQKVFYRLFAGMILEIHKARNALAGFDKDIMLVFCKGLLAMQPRYFQGFSFGWIALISHRLLLPVVLKGLDQAGWDVYIQLTEALLEYSSELVTPTMHVPLAKDMYRAVLRILLILHHDFPEFLAENHIRLCNAIPAYCTQLRNLVISAYPSTYPELPDPFSATLKVDRIEDVRKDPIVRYDVDADLVKGGINVPFDALLASREDEALDLSQIAQIVDLCNRPTQQETFEDPVPVYDHVLITAIVFALGTRAVADSKAVVSAKPPYNAQSVHARVLSLIARKLQPEARYHFLSAMVNQLRFPNSHTHWFSAALLNFFTPEALALPDAIPADEADAAEQTEQLEEVRQQATRVLLERLLVHRPHPWGLIVTLLELLKNEKLGFWEMDAVKSNPEVSEFVQQMVNMGPRGGTVAV